VARRARRSRRLIAVTRSGDAREGGEKQFADRFNVLISRQLDLDSADEKVIVLTSPAKRFLGEELSLAAASQYFPQGESLFDEVTAGGEPTSTALQPEGEFGST
jgi:hypothetical protein